MGIRSLNVVLREHAPGTFQNLHLGALHGYRVAVDAHIWLHANMSVAYRESVMNMVDPLAEIDKNDVIGRCLRSLLNFNTRFNNFGVTTVWVWDGDVLPDKKVCIDSRIKAKERVIQRITESRALLESQHPLERTPEDLEAYRRLISQDSCVTSDDIKQIRGFLDIMGIPSIVADHDAEKLCASLAKEGLVAGVWSTDTDNMAYGTPMMITGFSGVDEKNEPLVSIAVLHNALTGLRFTHSKFVDMCILLGTDYNNNMPNVGPKRVWSVMEKYDSIEELKDAEPLRPYNILNYERSREIFKTSPSGYSHDSKELTHKKEYILEIREYLEGLNLGDLTDIYIESLKNVPEPKATWSS